MGKEDEVRLIAYSIWEQEDCPNHKDCEHWFRAEAIWEDRQKREAVSNGIKTQAKPATRQNSKKMAARRKP